MTSMNSKTRARAAKLVPVTLAVLFAAVALFGIWVVARGIAFMAGWVIGIGVVLAILVTLAAVSVGVARARRRRATSSPS